MSGYYLSKRTVRIKRFLGLCWKPQCFHFARKGENVCDNHFWVQIRQSEVVMQGWSLADSRRRIPNKT